MENNWDEEENLISSEADIADDVKIGRGVIIGSEVTISPGCEIAPGVEIRGRTFIGRDNYIDRDALLGFAPQHLGYEGEPTNLIIGDNNYIGIRTTLHRGTEERGETRIGDGNQLAACVHIAHDCLLGDHINIEEFTQLGGHIEIGSRTEIEALVGLHQYVRVGRGAVIEAQAKVNQDVPPFLRAGGHPALLKGTGNCLDSEVKLKMGRAFELLCRSNCNTSQALERIEDELEGPEITEFVTFLRNSDRGVCR